MRKTWSILIFLGLLVGLLAVQADDPLKGVVTKIVTEIRQSRAANQKALANYSWHQRTDFILNGEKKAERLEQIVVRPDGKYQKISLSDPLDGKKVRGISNRKMEELKDYMERLVPLAMSYVSPKPEKFQEAYAAGKVRIGRDAKDNVYEIEIWGFFKPGDNLTLSFDRLSKAIRWVTVTSYLNDRTDIVKMKLNFKTLPDGTVYMSDTTAVGQARNITVTMTNFNHLRIAR